MEETISVLVESYENGRVTRRQLVQKLAMLVGAVTMGRNAAAAAAAPPPSGPSNFHTVNINHISLRVKDVVRTKDWYTKMFNLKVLKDVNQFQVEHLDRKSTRLNSSHLGISY